MSRKIKSTMIEKLRALGWLKRLTPARFRVTDSNHTIGNKADEGD